MSGADYCATSPYAYLNATDELRIDAACLLPAAGLIDFILNCRGAQRVAAIEAHVVSAMDGTQWRRSYTAIQFKLSGAGKTWQTLWDDPSTLTPTQLAAVAQLPDAPADAEIPTTDYAQQMRLVAVGNALLDYHDALAKDDEPLRARRRIQLAQAEHAARNAE